MVRVGLGFRVLLRAWVRIKDPIYCSLFIISLFTRSPQNELLPRQIKKSIRGGARWRKSRVPKSSVPTKLPR